MERRYIANYFGFTCLEALEYLLAFKHRSVAVDIFGCDPGFNEALLQMLRVVAVNTVN
jgi:hypothetical protein